MRDLGVWLEADGGALPPEFFAAVRIGEDASQPPARCLPSEASCLGRYATDGGGGHAVVDIFQRVGSVSLGRLQQGVSAEAAVDWPGLSATLRLRVVVAVDYGDVQKETAAPELPLELREVTSAFLPEQGDSDASMSPTTPALVQHQPPIPAEAVDVPRPKPVARLGVLDEDARNHKIYKPISLNDCDNIIPNLFLGGMKAVEDHTALDQSGIRAICCCTREFEMPSSEFSPQVEYYRVDVEDISREPIEMFFAEATEFIHSWISREQPVLVHCRAGVSRSASIVIAYLMTYQGYSLHDAFFLVRSHRSIITPNIGFMEKLGDYEEERGAPEATIEINKYMGWYMTAERPAVPDLKPD
mmetsp:Transcript_9394/g.27923  ORF Transcript_9394/g.27923 Transcript_9394/m.27923 type:complete len:358 (+) Transcript_9394:125-1198(+)